MTEWSGDDLTGLTRPMPLDVDWPAPVGVRVDEKWVSWDRALTAERGGRVRVGPEMLERFAALHRAGDPVPAIESYALDFGVLGLTDEGVPLSSLDATELADREVSLRRRRRDREPAQGWLGWSRRTDAVLRVAGACTVHRKPRDADLLALARDVLGWRASRPAEHLQSADAERVEQLRMQPQRLVAGIVSSWLAMLQVGIRVDWPQPSRPAVLAISGSGAGGLPTLVLQIGLVMTRAQAAYTCAGCGAPHTPRRLPREGERSFCEDCRRARVPVKLAQRDRRARMKEAR